VGRNRDHPSRPWVNEVKEEMNTSLTVRKVSYRTRVYGGLENHYVVGRQTERTFNASTNDWNTSNTEIDSSKYEIGIDKKAQT